MNATKFRTLKYLLHFFLKTRLFYGVYLLLLMTIETKGTLKVKQEENSWENDSIIVFDKTGLMEDLIAVSEYPGSELPNLVIIPRYVVNILAEYFLDSRQRQDFLPNQEFDEYSHAKYQSLWSFLLPRISRRFQSRILVTANYTYGTQRDIYEVASSLDWAVVVLFKECFMSEANSKNRMRLFKNSRPFTGTKILAYNESEIGRQLLSGNAEKHQLSVTGSPRFDQLIASKEKKVKIAEAKIIFFPQDYISEESFWHLSKEQIDFSIHHNNQISFGLESTLRLAEAFPELRFEIKSKITLSTQEFILNWKVEKTIPHNLDIVLGGGLALNSLTNCVGAFGFNTTALVDALAIGARIAVLRHRIDNEKDSDFLVNFETAEVIKEYLDLEKWIDNLVSQGDDDGYISLKLSEEDRAYLDRAVGNSDSKSSIRVLAELKALDNLFGPRKQLE